MNKIFLKSLELLKKAFDVINPSSEGTAYIFFPKKKTNNRSFFGLGIKSRLLFKNSLH